ncbi:MAG: hypothetical protein ACR2RA_01220 [Geminicoccaceae bacterium]
MAEVAHQHQAVIDDSVWRPLVNEDAQIFRQLVKADDNRQGILQRGVFIHISEKYRLARFSAC